MDGYTYVIADVFTDRAFGGNQLAVFPDATGLLPEVMQQIAREFNFAESTFVVPSTRSDCAARIRIFTPRQEMPFAGHPTIGTAAVLSYLKIEPLKTCNGFVSYEEGIGPVAVRVLNAGASAVTTELAIEPSIEYPKVRPDARDVANALTLKERDIIDTWYAGIGPRFCFVHLVSKAAVDAAVLDRQAWSAGLSKGWGPQLFIYSGSATESTPLHARMFAPGLGVDEDPATGSAGVALAGKLAEADKSARDVFSITINQGVSMGRPSVIRAHADRADGRTRRLRLGGTSVIVAQGVMRVAA